MKRRRHRPEAAGGEPQSTAEGTLYAVALVQDGAGHRLVELRLPADLALQHAEAISEPELLAVQMDAASDALLREQGEL